MTLSGTGNDVCPGWLFGTQKKIRYTIGTQFTILRLATPGFQKQKKTREPLIFKASGYVGLVGLEPMTPTMSTWCSNQLSYNPTGSTTGIIAWPKEKSKAFFKNVGFVTQDLEQDIPPPPKPRPAEGNADLYTNDLREGGEKQLSFFASGHTHMEKMHLAKVGRPVYK